LTTGLFFFNQRVYLSVQDLTVKRILPGKKGCCLTGMISIVSLLILHQTCLAEQKLSKSLSEIYSSDTTVKVWVFFTDKPERPSGNLVTARALSRRKRCNFSSSEEMDYPVSPKYLQRVQRTGAALNHVYKWENCASFYVHASRLSEIAALPIVKKVQPVFTFRNKFRGSEKGLQKRGLADSLYGWSYSQLKKINVPAAHDYLSRFRNVTEPGSGVMIAVFDAGFRFDHSCFSYLKEKGKIKAAWDFIDNDSTVYDPDSVYSNPNSRSYQNDEHGSTVLSLISGYDPGYFIGTAWGSELVLARTENGIFDGEFHYEEDNWFRAVVWAESIGVDIISSSLAYRTDFSDSTIIIRSGDSISVQDYQYDDLDGKTTLVSRAALYAIERGMVIVNAIGNEGAYTLGTLSAPADVEEVISVGSIDAYNDQVAYFSSTGPTADGRIKPDLVAQGTDVALPVIYGGGAHDYSAYGQGTSFSTPMIAGVCALIMQSYSGCTANDVRDRLYRYCKLLDKNKTADNYCGRGLPNALLSCMRDDEVYITVKDTAEKPVPLALITSQDGDSLGITDEDGIALVKLKQKVFPLNLFINVSGLQKPLTISSVPSAEEVVISINSGLLVQLEDKSGSVINGAMIYYKIPEVQDSFVSRNTDSLGRVLISMYREVPVQIYAAAEGYFRSDTVKAQICSDLCTLKLLLEKIPDHRFIVYPNVLKKGRERALFIDFIPGKGANNKIMLSIVSIDGAVVWKKAVFPGISERFNIKLDSELNRLVPGFYFLILENERNAFRRKFLIAG